MTKPLPWSGRIALLSLLPAVLLPLFFGERPPTVPSRPARFPVSRFHDWTTSHAVFGRTGTVDALEAARSEPRAVFRWREIEQQGQFAQNEARERQLESFFNFRFPRGPHRFPVRSPSDVHSDWSISLGGGSTAAGQFPAKFTFDTTAPVTAPASCTSDFIVYPVNVAGSSSQPNLVGFANLYSGTAGAKGMCNRTPTGNDTGVAATVLWSYNVQGITAGGAVPTSPVLSLDGTKVAFVESGSGAAHFHVLAWKSGDGQVANLQSVTTPKSIIAPFSGTAPAAGSGTATDLSFGTTTDTLSSPYVDYAHDTAYVGNDAGVLFRFKNVFCTTATCGTATPSLDSTWGGTGSVNVPCAATLTGPVQDFYTMNIFVGCSDGKVYGFTSTGAALTIPSIAVGNGSTLGGVVESPVVDGLNGFIYAVSGTGAAPHAAHAVLVQATTTLSAPGVALIGDGGFRNLHAPAFNDPYFSSATSTTWLIYTGAFDATGANLTLYGSTFNGSRNMATGAPANSFNIGTRPGEYAPLTEFKNGTNDYLFIGILIAPPNFARSTINAFPAVAPTQPGTGLPATSTGTSGMVVDNANASAQASSIYFASPGSNTAVKYTQVGLQ